MINGMIISKKHNNFIQNLYKILYYTFMKNQYKTPVANPRTDDLRVVSKT